MNVQHICEEHIKVPVAYPVKEPYPVKAPYPVKEPYPVPHDQHVHIEENPHHPHPKEIPIPSSYDVPQPKDIYGPPAPLKASPPPLHEPANKQLDALTLPQTKLPIMDHPASLGGVDSPTLEDLMSAALGGNISPTLGGSVSSAFGGNISPTPGGNKSPTFGRVMSQILGGNVSPSLGVNGPPTLGGSLSPTFGGNVTPTLGGNKSPMFGNALSQTLRGNVLPTLGGSATFGGVAAPTNLPQTLGGSLARRLFQRQKRAADGQKYTSRDTVQGIVKQALLDAIQRKEAIADGIETKKEARKADPHDYPFSLPLLPHSAHSVHSAGFSAVHLNPELAKSALPFNPNMASSDLQLQPGLAHAPHHMQHPDFPLTPHHSPAGLIAGIPYPDISKAGFKFPEPLKLPDFGIDELNEALGPSLNETDVDLTEPISVDDNINFPDELANPAELVPPNHHNILHPLNPDLTLGGKLNLPVPKLLSPHHHKLHHAVHHSFPGLPHGHPAPEHPPIVSTYEIPSQPGCRSLATKTCHKIPIVVPKKVPFETCKDVPDVECVTVLKNVPEVNCTPEPYEECNDLARDIPYLEPAEECEEIAYDDCVEVRI